MEINQYKRRAVSTKVDLTAMVDLGFLLITFFMLATTFSKPKTMEVFMPAADGDPSPYPESKTAILLLGTSDKLITYALPDEMTMVEGFSIDSMDYSPTGLRKYIQRRQAEVAAMWGEREKLFVIIKPMPGSSFKNMVDVLDEMLINDVKRYAIVKPNTQVDSMVIRLAGEKWGKG